MFVFYFIEFVGKLDIQIQTHEGISPESPVMVLFKIDEDLSKHEIVRRFRKLLLDNQITYLHPVKNLTSEWVFNLKEFRHSYDCLEHSTYLNAKITIEPECVPGQATDKYTGEITSRSTTLKFVVYPEDVNIFGNYSSSLVMEELKGPLQRFRKDYSTDTKTAFLMMKFEDSPIQLKLIEVIEQILRDKVVYLLRADSKLYADDLLPNIRTYMHGCDFGVAIFDRVRTEYFNPNVSLEIGYMMALGKDVLLLKDSTLNSLHTDLVGRLYYEYDFQNPEQTLPKVLNQWLNDKEIVV